MMFVADDVRQRELLGIPNFRVDFSCRVPIMSVPNRSIRFHGECGNQARERYQEYRSWLRSRRITQTL